MEAEGIMCREEGSVTSYLGVHIDCKKDGSMLLTHHRLMIKCAEGWKSHRNEVSSFLLFHDNYGIQFIDIYLILPKLV